MNRLFKPIDQPEHYDMQWYTWSDSVREDLRNSATFLGNMEIKLAQILPEQKYGLSYLPSNSKPLPESINTLVKKTSELLVSLKLSNDIILLKDTIFPGFTQKELHAFFSLIAEEIRYLNKQNACLHSPIEEKEKDDGFPVHADLYKSKILFNIISDAKNEKGGDINLLSAKALDEAMQNTSSLPNAIRQEINSILLSRPKDDMFDYTFDLMYGKHSWTKELGMHIKEKQLLLPTEKGTGYILVDGSWLHGRSKIHGAARKNRLQRLIFDTEQSLEIPYFEGGKKPPPLVDIQDKKGISTCNSQPDHLKSANKASPAVIKSAKAFSSTGKASLH